MFLFECESVPDLLEDRALKAFADLIDLLLFCWSGGSLTGERRRCADYCVQSEGARECFGGRVFQICRCHIVNSDVAMARHVGELPR